MCFIDPTYYALTVQGAVIGGSVLVGHLIREAIGTLGLSSFDTATLCFIGLFIFRYLRLVVHLISFWLFYRPAPLLENPSYHPSDCTILLPTVDPENVDFSECLQSCLLNRPGAIIVITVGEKLTALTQSIIGPYQAQFPATKITVLTSRIANKRIQVAQGIPLVQTKITILLDDHVFWPSLNFLPNILAPFEDVYVGSVGTNKRVRRTDLGFNARSFWNMMGAVYLERHNFEIRATNAIDGGVFVISGRTSAHRTRILQDQNFLDGFTNERFCLGKFGPLNADDDNFITRWMVRNGWKIKIQYSKEAVIETTLGTYPKFLSQCLRWVRTTWRSNSASLFTDRTVWRRQPWCVYAVYLTSFVNFALFYDLALMYTLRISSLSNEQNALAILIFWIFLTKMVKLTPYFLRRPQDLIFLPGYFAFAYFHSFLKLYAGLTFWVTAWGGRNLEAIDAGNSSAPGRNSFVVPYSPSSSISSSDSGSTVGPSRNSFSVPYPSSSSSSSSGSGGSRGSNNSTPAPAFNIWGEVMASDDAAPDSPAITRRRIVPLATPWGTVVPGNRPDLRSANVLDSQMLNANRPLLRRAGRPSTTLSDPMRSGTLVWSREPSMSPTAPISVRSSTTPSSASVSSATPSVISISSGTTSPSSPSVITVSSGTSTSHTPSVITISSTTTSPATPSVISVSSGTTSSSSSSSASRHRKPHSPMLSPPHSTHDGQERGSSLCTTLVNLQTSSFAGPTRTWARCPHVERLHSKYPSNQTCWNRNPDCEKLHREGGQTCCLLCGVCGIPDVWEN